MDDATARVRAPGVQRAGSATRQSAGSVIVNRYVLDRRLASGGMGEVWLATDNVLERRVAVKILSVELVDSAEFLERFRAEARHTASLGHPGIASIFDYGEDASYDPPLAFLVMEFVDGEPLSKRAERAPRIAMGAIVDILIQIAEALQAAHERGVIHRDVKPGNVMVAKNGRIKVTDFGIARAVDSVPLTAAGQVVGTAAYMSPEQACGGDVTTSSDVYSLGVVGYELLAGRTLFAASNPAAVALAHVQQLPAPLPPTVPAGVRRVIDQTLAKKPSDRPVSALAVADALRAAAAEIPPPADSAATALMAVLAGATGTGAVSAPDPSIAGAAAAGEPTEVMAAAGTRSATAVMPAGFLPGAPVRPTVAAELAARRRRRRMAAAIGLAAAVALVVVTFATAGDGEDPTQGTVSTEAVIDPNVVVGMPEAEAAASLEQSGVVVDVRRAAAAGVAAGTVIGVEPAGPVAAGEAVTLVVADGAPVPTDPPTTSPPQTAPPDENDRGRGNGKGNGKNNDD